MTGTTSQFEGLLHILARTIETPTGTACQHIPESSSLDPMCDMSTLMHVCAAVVLYDSPEGEKTYVSIFITSVYHIHQDADISVHPSPAR